MNNIFYIPDTELDKYYLFFAKKNLDGTYSKTSVKYFLQNNIAKIGDLQRQNNVYEADKSGTQNNNILNSNLLQIFTFIDSNFEDIIRMEYGELLKLNDRLTFLLLSNNIDIDNQITFYNKNVIVKSSLKDLFKNYIFNYKSLDTAKRKFIIKKIRNKVCPYCSRNFIGFIEGVRNNLGTNLDHFFPQDDYPLLGISFFNLIPSCFTCNSSLKSKKILMNDNFHPAERGLEFIKLSIKLESNEKFRVEFFLSENSFSICEKPNYIDGFDDVIYKKLRNNFNFFELWKIYNYHKNIVQKMLVDYYIYSENDLVNSINKIFPKLNIKSPIIGVAISKQDSVLEPFGKLKSDIYETLVNKKADKTNIHKVF